MGLEDDGKINANKTDDSVTHRIENKTFGPSLSGSFSSTSSSDSSQFQDGESRKFSASTSSDTRFSRDSDSSSRNFSRNSVHSGEFHPTSREKLFSAASSSSKGGGSTKHSSFTEKEGQKAFESSQRSEAQDNSYSSSFWAPWAALALAVHETLVSVGHWAWDSAQQKVQELLGSAQEKTSAIYETVKYRSSVAVQDCQEAASSLYEDLHGRVQSRCHGAAEEVVQSCSRCKENMQLAVLQTKLRVGLASNSIHLRSESLRLDVKQKFSEKYENYVARPIMEARSKLRSVRNHTTQQIFRYKTRITGNVKENLDAVSLKAMEYEDHFDDKFPGIVKRSAKPVQNSQSEGQSIMCQMVKVEGAAAPPSPLLQ
ncbi:hypothetical protein FHG87_007128 [Trinorchestia longiramus]|nr:hypothetical protein FHG87_007128 [Trinorchestia longiramus]